MAGSKEIHRDTPISTAWQEGRRIYVRCGRASPLNQDLRALGTHWDKEQRARWIGVHRKADVVEAVLAGEARKKAIEDVKAAGRWVWIPYPEHGIRERAKELPGVYGGKQTPGS